MSRQSPNIYDSEVIANTEALCAIVNFDTADNALLWNGVTQRRKFAKNLQCALGRSRRARYANRAVIVG